MNEFIVWDKLKKCFADDICLDAELLQDGISYSLEVKEELFELFYPVVGLKDINGKSIYADSYIVEFELNINKEEVKIIGYFSYIKEELRYEFYQHFKQREKFIKTYLSPSDSRLTGEFKIIDTIQENKLGLIK